MTELIENVFESTKTQDNDGDNNDKAYYLRWVGDDPRGQTRANFSQDFSSLAADFELPKNVFQFLLDHYGISIWNVMMIIGLLSTLTLCK